MRLQPKSFRGRLPDLILATIYMAAAYPSFASIASYARASGLFVAWGSEVAVAIAVDGLVVFGFFVFAKSPIFATIVIAMASGSSFALQELHAASLPPASQPWMVRGFVAAVPQGAVVLAAWAWHLTRSKPASTPEPRAKATLTRRSEPEEERLTLTERTTTERVREVSGGAVTRAVGILQEAGQLLPVADLAERAGVSARTAKTARALYRKENGDASEVGS